MSYEIFVYLYECINIIRSMPTKYHDIYSMSVQRCQQMLMSNDYMLICNGSKPLIKARAKKAYMKFTEELRVLFGGDEDLLEAIDKDALIMRLGLRKSMLTGLRDSLTWCYSVKSNIKGQIEAFSETKKLYRQIFFDYPKVIDENLSDEQYKEAVANILNPINSEIQRLEYKIKELAPPVKEVVEEAEEKKTTGLELHIMFLQSVSPEHFYRQMSVHDFSKAYNVAVKKSSKLNAK